MAGTSTTGFWMLSPRAISLRNPAQSRNPWGLSSPSDRGRLRTDSRAVSRPGRRYTAARSGPRASPAAIATTERIGAAASRPPSAHNTRSTISW